MIYDYLYYRLYRASHSTSYDSPLIFNFIEYPPQPFRRKKPQHQQQSHVGLLHGVAAGAVQKPLDVGRGRIRRIELRERRREQQDAG